MIPNRALTGQLISKKTKRYKPDYRAGLSPTPRQNLFTGGPKSKNIIYEIWVREFAPVITIRRAGID